MMTSISPTLTQRQNNLREFAKAVIKDNYASETTNYLGTITQAFKQGVIKRQSPLMPKLMQTERTWRACRGCHAGRIVMVEHVTGQISARKCHSCQGSGKVFG